MLADQLPAIPFSPDYNLEFTSECMALTYLAGYNDQAIQPRVMTSFQRAYAMTNILMRPFVPDGAPGYCIAIWNDESVQRVTVAIEGTRSDAQLRRFWGGYQATQVTAPNQWVFEPFEAHAATIFAALLADPVFAGVLAQNGYVFTFTGHSLGAAVAERLAAKLKAYRPAKVIKCVKFGSPRVGNRSYVRNLSQNIWRENWYYNRDPVDVLPYFTLSSDSNFLNLVGASGTWYAQDGNATRIDPRGYYLDPFHAGGAIQAAQYLRSFGQPRTIDNAWYDHLAKSYRYGFLAYTNWYNSLAKWRFRYLEFNDENGWGINFNNQGTWTDAMQALISPDPDPVDVDCPQFSRIRIEQPAGEWGDQPRIPLQNFDAESGGTAIGGDWGDPAQPEVAPIRAIVAPPPRIFSRRTPGRRR